MDEVGKKGANPYAQFAGAGLQFAGGILLFLYIGRWADRQLGTEPVFLYVGVFGGAAASFYNLYRKLMAVQREEERQRKPRS